MRGRNALHEGLSSGAEAETGGADSSDAKKQMADRHRGNVPVPPDCKRFAFHGGWLGKEKRGVARLGSPAGTPARGRWVLAGTPICSLTLPGETHTVLLVNPFRSYAMVAMHTCGILPIVLSAGGPRSPLYQLSLLSFAMIPPPLIIMILMVHTCGILHLQAGQEVGYVRRHAQRHVCGRGGSRRGQGGAARGGSNHARTATAIFASRCARCGRVCLVLSGVGTRPVGQW